MHIDLRKSQLQHFGLGFLSEYYTDGQQVIDRVKLVCEESVQNSTVFPIKPVSVILLDFQMPIKNGLETVLELKQYYKDLAVRYDRALTADLFI